MTSERITIVQAAREYGMRVHNAAGCTYGDDNEGYIIHLDAVHNLVEEHQDVFLFDSDKWYTRAAAYTHDTIEDAQQTFNDVMVATNFDVATITLAVTDVPEMNRLLRHMMTLPKTIKDYRAIILKMCDLTANSGYGKGVKNGMYKKYQEEYVYKRYIFQKAVKWYDGELDLKRVANLFFAMDRAHGFSHQRG